METNEKMAFLMSLTERITRFLRLVLFCDDVDGL